MTFTKGLIGTIMAGSGFACPTYATVTLRLFSAPYTPPVSGATCILKLLACPYTPPIA